MGKRRIEQSDEYAETQVLHEAKVQPKDLAKDLDADTLSLYAEYERELADHSTVEPRPARSRR